MNNQTSTHAGSAETMDIEALAAHISDLNDAYRRGEPMVSDEEYDHYWLDALRKRAPNHPYLAEPEPEPEVTAGNRVKHLAPMLSTDKAYTDKEVDAWANRVSEALGRPAAEVEVRITPKLDGIAAHVSGTDAAYTRGKGGYGTNLLPLFREGIIAADGVDGPGEIVVSRNYFDDVLAGEFSLSHPRNFVAGFVAADSLEPYHHRAIADQAVRFVPYSTLPAAKLTLAELTRTWNTLFERLVTPCDYLCDGLVVEIVDPEARARLGSTSHHHRWQLALKRNDESVLTKVKSVRYTTGRTGRICPTVELEPVSLYGVTITWATAHNHQRLVEWGIGPGAVVQIFRSGGVIPKIGSVHQPVTPAPSMSCPCCDSAVEMRGPTAFCPNSLECSAQSSARLNHFYRTLGTCKGFGPGVCAQLADAGFTRPSQIWKMGAEAMVAVGISPGIAANLRAELRETLSRPVSEAFFLAAQGIPHLGRGDSRKLLAEYPLNSLGQITAEQIAKVHGFAEKTAQSIATDLRALWPEIEAQLSLGWTFDRVLSPAASSGPLAGKTLVFTGAMTQPRDAMENQARSLGATVGSSVSAKTTILVCGDKVGASKTDKARALGVTLMTEAQYQTLISGATAEPAPDLFLDPSPAEEPFAPTL